MSYMARPACHFVCGGIGVREAPERICQPKAGAAGKSPVSGPRIGVSRVCVCPTA